MNRYQFRPSLVDHSQFFVIVRPFYRANEQDFSSVSHRLAKYQFAKPQNDSNKIIRFRFHKGFPRDHMDWGEMQIHRRPVGLLAVARLTYDPSMQPEDLEKIQDRFANVRLQYESVLFDSRCIILCKEKPADPPKPNFIFLEDTDDGQSIEFFEFMHDFMSSLFVVLESKRIEKENEKLDKMKLPFAPIEHEQGIIDSDNRTQRRRLLGRNRKLLADLCLMSGMYQDALVHYGHSSENLKFGEDHLWMGAALEGLCATSIIMTKIEVPVIDSKLILKSSGISNASQGDLNLEDDKSKVYVPLTDDKIVAKYSEVLSCYRKFQTGHIEMEAHIKFVKLLLSMKKILEACQVIQSLFNLELGYNDSERVDLCQVIAALFEQVHLKRKAAFFRRRAAQTSFKQNNANAVVLKYAYSALLKTTGGYMLNLKPHERPKSGIQDGWSSIQLGILLDMLQVSNRLDDTMNCIRLLCFILENYCDILSPNKKYELTNRLEDCAAKAEEEKSTKQYDNMEMIRPLPIVRNFKPRPLANHLQPKKQKLDSDHGGPFIFSSLSFQARHKKTEKEILWVCGDVAEVGMTVDNPLPAEIKVRKMILVTEGIQFEAFPATLALPAESGSFPFMLLGTPKSPGQLIIKGYQVDVFGIENTILLDNPITVQVAPSLPLVRLSSSLQTSAQNQINPDDEHYQTLFTSLSSYRGHSTPTTLMIENIGKMEIKSLSLKIKKATEKVISYDDDLIKSVLPLEAGKSVDLSFLLMNGEAWKIQPFAEKINCTLTLFYSGEEDFKTGYGREISFVVDIKVMPSLSISNYDVYEIDKHPCCCCLCFDVENHSSIDMKIETVVCETEDIKPGLNCPCRAETFMPAKGLKRIGVHFPRCLLFLPNLRMNQSIEKVYSKAIKESVSIHWTLSDSRYGGVTYLADLSCTSDMVNVLKPRHLEMRISVNHTVLREGEEVSTVIGHMTHLHIQLTNAHEFDLHDLNLNIKPHQGEEDLGNNSDASAPQLPLLSHCGTLKKATQKLSPGEILDHSCGLLFLFAGDFIVDVTCKINASLSRVSLKRGRTRPVTADISSGVGSDMTDAGSNDFQVFVDGTVAPLKGEKAGQTIEGKVLHKPMLNNWERRLIVHVQ